MPTTRNVDGLYIAAGSDSEDSLHAGDDQDYEESLRLSRFKGKPKGPSKKKDKGKGKAKPEDEEEDVAAVAPAPDDKSKVDDALADQVPSDFPLPFLLPLLLPDGSSTI